MNSLNYFNSLNSLFPLLLVCNKFSIPSDISKIIYYELLNSYAQTIINHWYSHIVLHNTNLCILIQKLNLYIHYDTFGMPFYYYDLFDKKVGITFNICYKYIDLNISSIEWWINRLNYAFNALSLIRYQNNLINYNFEDIFKYNYNAISNFYDLLCDT